MKKNLNVIQIKGTRGLLLIAGIACCLAAGFIWFPGWIGMNIWNYAAKHFEQMPYIGIIQGILLWGIIVASYFTFRRDKLVVCMHSSDGLTEEELKQVFADLRQKSSNDTLIQSMLKAREAELKIKNLSESDIPKADKKENEEILNSK